MYRRYFRAGLALVCWGIIGFGALAAFAYHTNDLVQTLGSFNIRQTPAGTPLGTQSLGSRGVVIGGPTVATLNGSPLTWWNVNFDSGTDGWIADSGLTTAWAVGADVYSGNSTINWNQVKAAGISFAFAKASEGLTLHDSKYLTYMYDAHQAGVLIGSYHFSHPLTHPGTNGAVMEAQNFLSIARPYIKAGWLPPVLDIEDEPFGTDPGDPCSDGTVNGNTSINLVCKLGKPVLSEWVRAWVNEVIRQTGVTPMLYMNRNSATLGMEADLAACPLWLAYFKNPPDIAQAAYAPWTNSWTFLQYSFTNTLSGVSQPTVDFNLFNGDPRALQLFSQQIGTTNVIPAIFSDLGGGPIRPPANGQFKFEVSSAAQLQVVIQSSTNLAIWADAGTVTISHGHGVFTDTFNGAAGKKYYRPHP